MSISTTVSWLCRLTASGLLAHSDRRLAAMRQHYEEELRLAREETHKLVTASLRHGGADSPW